MTTRPLHLGLLVGIALMLLSCGLFGGGQEAEENEAGASSRGTTVEAAVASPGYFGPSSLEERVFESPVIARVRLDSVSSAAESGTTYRGTKYIATLEFSFSVLAYLKGSGADDIVVVWAAAPFFDTRQEAEDALPAIAAARDAQWDDREAVLFLQQDSGGFLASTQQASRYYLAWGGSWMDYGDYNDGYSIASRHDKLWLPAAAAPGDTSQASGDQQGFLTDVPPAMGTAPTITLGEIKTGIAAVAAKLAAGDGSEEYTECVQRTYQYEGRNRYWISTGRDGYFYRTPDQELGSGLAASSVVYETKRAEVWLEGGDIGLFVVESSAGVLYDSSEDGTNDSIRYTQRVVSARPLPAGVYRTHHNLRDRRFVPCAGYTYRHEWTVTVNGPPGTLHEAFFDPVTDGTAVAADDANGVLKPASFTDATGATAAIQRITWEAGAVKLKLTPHTGIADHIVDFIALDGTVSLSLMRCRCDGGRGERHAELDGGVTAVGGRGAADAAHPARRPTARAERSWRIRAPIPAW